MLVALALLGVLIAGGKMAFSRWQQRSMVSQALEFLRQGDMRSAYLMANRAFQKDPLDAAACRIAAQVAESERSPAAILWRQKVADIFPGADAPLIELAVTATGFGETFIAEAALSQVNEKSRNTVACLQAAAGLAIAERQFAAAEGHFLEALKTEPQNERLQLSLAVLRTGMRDSKNADEAKAVLERLGKKPQFRKEALRALLTGARMRGDSARSLQIAAELRNGTDASLADELCYLEELRHAGRPEFDGELQRIRDGAGSHPEVIYAVMTWMNARGLVPQSIQWCESLPAMVRAQLPIPLAEAEARTALADWRHLREIVRDADWGDLEFLRFAIHARVLYETYARKRRAEFRAMWERATNATKGNTNALSMLARLVTGWGWKDEAAQIWWLVTRNSTGQRPALKALYAMHSADRNTRELHRVARRVLEIEPGNPVAKNNVASLALLLGEDEPEAHRLAAENFRQSPEQPAFAMTHAFSLHRQKRTAEAVAVLKKFPPQAFGSPSAAACYGFLLAENGEHDAAKPLLELAERQKQQLFPEEAAMVADALHRIQ
jgi:predicted Zn-dependent protease